MCNKNSPSHCKLTLNRRHNTSTERIFRIENNTNQELPVVLILRVFELFLHQCYTSETTATCLCLSEATNLATDNPFKAKGTGQRKEKEVSRFLIVFNNDVWIKGSSAETQVQRMQHEFRLKKSKNVFCYINGS